jgi:type II secretory ATPase GspE/PulE/Tfp pilus assembly ATPase PilB-like protein
VRLLCPACSLPSHPDPAVQEALGIPDELVEAGTIRAPGGCAQCGHTGYRGRTAIYEVLAFSEDMSRLLASGASASELQRWAIADGMNTMRGNALARVIQGDVSVDEYLRVFA